MNEFLQLCLLFACVTINAADFTTFRMNYLTPHFAATVFQSIDTKTRNQKWQEITKSDQY